MSNSSSTKGLVQQALETGITLHRGTAEYHGGVRSPGTPRVDGGLWKRGTSIYGHSVRGT